MAEPTDKDRSWPHGLGESVGARLASVKHVQDQLRFSIGVMAVISMMILIASYNAYLSFDRSWTLELAGRSFPVPRSASDILTEQALRSWADSRNVLISLLGIRVNVDDAPVLGTLSLFVMSLWLLQTARRENRTIGFLLRDADALLSSEDAVEQEECRERRRSIFHSIISNSVFINIDHSLARVSTLRGGDQTREQRTEWRRRLEISLSKLVSGFFFYFPPGACVVMFFLDRLSYFEASAFRPDSHSPGIGGFFWPSMVVFAACWVPLMICCVRARLYVSATEAVLREYRNTFDAATPAPGPAA